MCYGNGKDIVLVMMMKGKWVIGVKLY
jgi:hypothetical protein